MQTSSQASAGGVANAGEGKGPYTVTVYLAAPGTTVANQDGLLHSSSAGHAYFMVSNSKDKHGYGFSPISTGVMGPGQVVKDEYKTYQNPRYAYRLEITEEQYEKLKAYGEAGVNKNEKQFGLYYNGASNSCVDFVWTGLRQAGLRPKLDSPDRDFDGTMKVLPNLDALKSIPKPFPNSTLNTLEENPLPKKPTRLQKLLTEVEGQHSPERVVLSKDSQQLFDRMRSELATTVSDEQVLSAVNATRECGIQKPEQLRETVLHDGKIFVMGTTPGYRAMVDLNQPQQTLADEVNRSQQIDARLAEQSQQDSQQRDAAAQTARDIRMG